MISFRSVHSESGHEFTQVPKTKSEPNGARQFYSRKRGGLVSCILAFFRFASPFSSHSSKVTKLCVGNGIFHVIPIYFVSFNRSCFGQGCEILPFQKFSKKSIEMVFPTLTQLWNFPSPTSLYTAVSFWGRPNPPRQYRTTTTSKGVCVVSCFDDLWHTPGLVEAWWFKSSQVKQETAISITLDLSSGPSRVLLFFTENVLNR